MRVGIAGAGLLGRLLAWRLSRAGHEVDVFDPASGPARGETQAAGFTAAGLLSPLAELDCGSPAVAALGWRSLTLWPAWLDSLGRAVHFHAEGSLLVAHEGDLGSAARLLARIAAHAPDHAPESLAAAAVKALEPALARGVLAWRLRGEGAVHTVQAMDALHAAASDCGVRWHWSRPVREVEPYRLDDERFDLVFDVRGVGARPQLPVRGVRGELCWLHAPGLGLRHPLRLLHPRHRVYVVPRPGDIVVVGASEIESEDRSPWSVRTALELLSAAHSVLPSLAEARIVHSESQLRPALPDNLPLLHVEPGRVRLNGLFRHGWLVGPALVEQALSSLPEAQA